MKIIFFYLLNDKIELILPTIQRDECEHFFRQLSTYFSGKGKDGSTPLP